MGIELCINAQCCKGCEFYGSVLTAGGDFDNECIAQGHASAGGNHCNMELFKQCDHKHENKSTIEETSNGFYCVLCGTEWGNGS